MKKIIPPEEVSFHPLSFQDEAGRLFRWRGQLYRGLGAGSSVFLAELFENGIVQQLVAAGLLIDTNLTDLSLDGFSLILSHRMLPLVSHPFEWCAAMFKAASLLVLDLAHALARHDLVLKDAHPWNVLFDGCRPVWIDFTSIVPREEAAEWRADTEFYENCVYPLLLMSRGREKLARPFIAEYEAVRPVDLEMLGGSRSLLGDIGSAFLGYLPDGKRRFLRGGFRRARALFKTKEARPPTASLLERLGQIRTEVEEIAVPFEEARAESQSFVPDPTWNAKQRSVHQILSRTRPGTLLDIASGSGWFAQLAAQSGARVAAIDQDADAVGRLFASARRRDLSIVPLVMDFTRPTAARGLASHSHIAATERLRCEMVLMLGFLHDVVFRYRRLGLNEICDGLALFSARWLVVEFIPGDDPEVGPLWSPWFADYTLENFQKLLARHFSKIEVMPSFPGSRVLLFCER